MIFTKGLNDYDWLLLARLLAQNDSVFDCVELLEKMSKNKRAKQIAAKMKEGETIKTIFKFDGFERDVAHYSEYTDLSGAIILTYKAKQKKKHVKELLVSKLLYSVVLLISSIFVLILFSEFVLPSMLSTLTINENIDGLVKLFAILNIMKNIILIALLILVIAFGYISIKKRWSYLWIALHKINCDEGLKIVATYELVNELTVMTEQAIDLQSCLETIRYNEKKPLAALLASQLHNSLVKGVDFEEGIKNEFFDEGFSAVCLYGLQQSSFEEALAEYQKMIEIRMEQLISKVSLFVQVFCYLIVGIIIVASYKVLLLPLEMIEGL